MTHTPHELAEEFPHHADRIHELKTSDPHFAKLADKYHELNREIHRMETNVEPVSDDVLTEKKKNRLAIVDEISSILAA